MAPVGNRFQHELPEEFVRMLDERLEQQARNIGQLLHDSASQMLAAAYIALAQASQDLPAPAVQRLHEVRRHLAQVEEHVRQLAHELRPRVLDELGLAAALHFLACGFEARCGIPALVHTRIGAPLPFTLETAVYRIAQEALTNIGRHAAATRASIVIESDHRLLSCIVTDDGVGFDSARQDTCGLGLHGIRERVESLGGRFSIQSEPGAGTELTASIPVNQA